MNRKNLIFLLVGIVVIIGIALLVFRVSKSTESTPKPTQAEMYKLKNSYTSDSMTFQYPDGYTVERDTKTNTLIITGENSRIEILKQEENQDVPFGVEDDQTQDYADRNIPKDIKTLTGGSGVYDVKLFYQINDRKMKELLEVVVETIEIR